MVGQVCGGLQDEQGPTASIGSLLPSWYIFLPTLALAAYMLRHRLLPLVDPLCVEERVPGKPSDLELLARSVRFHDLIAPLHEELVGTHMHHGYFATSKGRDSSSDFREAQNETIRRLLRLGGFNDPEQQLAGLKILDVGCGVGASALYLARICPTVRVKGVSPSSYEVRRATEHLLQEKEACGGRVSFQVASGMDLPFGADCFDVVWCLESIEWCVHPRQFVAECVRILRPGGTLFMTSMGHRDTACALGGPLTATERRHLAHVAESLCLPVPLSPCSQLASLCSDVGLSPCTAADWTAPISPHWSAVTRSSLLSLTTLQKLLTPSSAALALRYVLGATLQWSGFRRGLLRYSAVAARKGTGSSSLATPTTRPSRSRVSGAAPAAAPAVVPAPAADSSASPASNNSSSSDSDSSDTDSEARGATKHSAVSFDSATLHPAPPNVSRNRAITERNLHALQRREEYMKESQLRRQIAEQSRERKSNQDSLNGGDSTRARAWSIRRRSRAITAPNLPLAMGDGSTRRVSLHTISKLYSLTEGCLPRMTSSSVPSDEGPDSASLISSASMMTEAAGSLLIVPEYHPQLSSNRLLDGSGNLSSDSDSDNLEEESEAGAKARADGSNWAAALAAVAARSKGRGPGLARRDSTAIAGGLQGLADLLAGAQPSRRRGSF